MATRKTSPTLSKLGERGFLKKFLPRLRVFKANRFLVPPGDDAAVLKGKTRLVLSIDGLTNGTHFQSSWADLCQAVGGFSLARGLAWKLLGSSLSDLAAMGRTKNRWAMTYLGAPGNLNENFLNDLYRGLRETAQKYDCVLVGGDTVRARELSLVSAVGGDLVGVRALTRAGAKPGDLICVAGTIGDAAIGLKILERKIRLSSRTDAAYFVRRFFMHEPMFAAASVLAQEKGVTSLIDLSDALKESVEIVCAASAVGAELDVDRVPVSPVYRRSFNKKASLVTGGEDYSFLFTLRPNALIRLEKKLRFSVIGRALPESAGVHVFLNGKKVNPSLSFQHFA